MTKEGTKLIPTVKEAEEIAFRFINGHFRNAGRDHPRMSIPADPMRDDDIRLLAFIRNSQPTPPTPAGAGTETPTPLTDAREIDMTAKHETMARFIVVADFARQLERELTAKKSDKALRTARELLERSFRHCLQRIVDSDLNESAISGTQRLSKEIAQFLDANPQPSASLDHGAKSVEEAP